MLSPTGKTGGLKKPPVSFAALTSHSYPVQTGTEYVNKKSVFFRVQRYKPLACLQLIRRLLPCPLSILSYCAPNQVETLVPALCRPDWQRTLSCPLKHDPASRKLYELTQATLCICHPRIQLFGSLGLRLLFRFQNCTEHKLSPRSKRLAAELPEGQLSTVIFSETDSSDYHAPF